MQTPVVKIIIDPRQALLTFFALIMLTSSCSTKQRKIADMEKESQFPKGTFGFDLQFLKQHQDVVVLSSEDSSARVLISPSFQARVMTSTSDGLSGKSYGWINYQAIDDGSVHAHINAFGGEERFWLGPEGGQFALYFKPGDPFDFEHWQVPPALDTEAFKLLDKNSKRALFGRSMNLTNYSGTVFNMDVTRSVELLGESETGALLKIGVPKMLSLVAYSTKNTITNTGNFEWTAKTGMPSIWLLGMFVPSEAVTVVIPYREGPGKVLTSDYFGEIPADRLKVQDGFIYFKCDGKFRSKLGLTPAGAKGLAASYDAAGEVLTVILCNQPQEKKNYVNSLWKVQDDPFSGDAINSYNDGPVADGTQMGPFYELESSSPAANLHPGESLTHISTTFHFRGDRSSLDSLAIAILGVSLNEIKAIFK